MSKSIKIMVIFYDSKNHNPNFILLANYYNRCYYLTDNSKDLLDYRIQ